MLRTVGRILAASLFLWIAASALAATPTLSSISPSTGYENGPSFTLTAKGSNFVSGASINFDYTPLTTTFVSSTELTAVVPASFLSETYNSSYGVYVQNPDGEQTGTLYFTVVALSPSISSISPSSAVAGSASTPITVSGDNFMSGATVLLNNFPVATTFVSTQSLQFTATKAQLSQASIAQIAVSNPRPGGVSSPVTFDVTYPVKTAILNLPANDMVWDPYAQRIYASLPSSYGPHGNSIAVISPSSGRVLNYYFAGSEPNQLAISADSSYLYVGLNGSSSVQRFILPSFTPDIVIPLSNQYGGSTALSLAVDPADPHTLAVIEGCCGDGETYFYKDTTELPNSILYPYINDLVFVSGSTAFGFANDAVTQVSIDSNGGTTGQQWDNLVTGTSIQYAGGLIYSNGGQAFNPATGLLVGSFDLGNNNCCYNPSVQVLPDLSVKRLFVSGTTPFFPQFGITTYDLTKFTPIATADLSQLSGIPSPAFFHWGTSGLAFILQPECCGNDSVQVVLLQSPSMFASGTANPVPAVQSLSPTNILHGSRNLLVTINGTNFVPDSQVTWNGVALFANFVSTKQLDVYVSAGLLASPGIADVLVQNPTPKGGTSGSLQFSIN